MAHFVELINQHTYIFVFVCVYLCICIYTNMFRRAWLYIIQLLSACACVCKTLRSIQYNGQRQQYVRLTCVGGRKATVQEPLTSLFVHNSHLHRPQSHRWLTSHRFHESVNYLPVIVCGSRVTHASDVHFRHNTDFGNTS